MDEQLLGEFGQFERLPQALLGSHSAKDSDVKLMVWSRLDIHVTVKITITSERCRFANQWPSLRASTFFSLSAYILFILNRIVIASPSYCLLRISAMSWIWEMIW